MTLTFSKRCPVCSHQFTRGQRREFATWWGARRVGTCPECSQPLMWPAGPWWIMQALGVLVLIVFFSVAAPLRHVLTVLGGVSILAVYSALRLIRVEVGGTRGPRTVPPPS
jgi:hypothetical protein